MNINIYQIFYHDSQKEALDPAFIPYNNADKVYPFNFEYAIFFDLYEKVDWSQTDFTGTVSWKFHQKTGLAGWQFLEYMDTHPGYDVYFVNPFPELCIYPSVWRHGDKFHKNLSHITRELFAACGYNPNILNEETPPNLTAYCNYWVANRKFWDAYIKFLRPFWNYVHQNDNQLTQTIQGTADPFIKAPYLPFIFERLFSTFLTMERFNVSQVPVHPDKILKNHFLAPVASQINRISHLSSHKDIRCIDKILLVVFTKARLLRHYHLPLLLKRERK